MPLAWPLLQPGAGGGRVAGSSCKQGIQERVRLWRWAVAHRGGLPRGSQVQGKLTSVNEIVPDKGKPKLAYKFLMTVALTKM